MFPNRAAAISRPAWQTNLFALLLVLATSAALLWILRDGPPTRVETAGMLAALALTPVVLRWQAGWMMVFLALPWIAWVRRIALYFDPTAAATESFDITLLLPDVIVAITVSGFLLTRHVRRRELPDPDEQPLNKAIAVFIGLCVVQVFNPMMGSVAAGVNGWRVFVLYIGLYWITRTVAMSRAAISAWVVAAVSFGGITGLYGAYQFLVGFPTYDIAWANASMASTQMVGDQMRAFSTFSFTSTFSHFMVIGAIVSWSAIRIEGIGRLMRLLAPLALVACLTGLAVTFVRSSFLGLMLAAVVTLVVAGSSARRLRRLVLVVALGIGAIVVMPSSAGDSQAYEQQSTGALVADRLLSMRDPGQSNSMLYRFDLWRRTIWLTTSSVPMGVGIGAGGGARFGGDGYATAVANTESQFVSILAETGWPGFILFLWITMYGFVFSVRTYDGLEDPDRKRLALMAIGLQVGILTTGVTGGTVLYTLPGSAYYWTALGLVAALRRAERAERGELTASVPQALPISGTAP